MTEQPHAFDVAEVALQQISDQEDCGHINAALILVDFATMVLTSHGFNKHDLRDHFDESIRFQLEIQAELEKEELEAEKEGARMQ